MRALPRRLVDEPDAARLEGRHRGVDVGDTKTEVMERFTALLQELRDRRVRAHGLDELERGAAGIDEAQSVRADHLRRVGRQADERLEQRGERCGIAHGDAHVIQRHRDAGVPADGP